MSSKRITRAKQDRVKAACTFGFGFTFWILLTYFSRSPIFNIYNLAELLPLFQIAYLPGVREKPLSGDDPEPHFKMESDLVTLKIWARLECKMKCRSFTAYQTASAFTQKKVFRNVQASFSEIL